MYMFSENFQFTINTPHSSGDAVVNAEYSRYYNKSVGMSPVVISGYDHTVVRKLSDNFVGCVSTDSWITQPSEFMTREELLHTLKKFEDIYGMHSCIFYEKWEKGEIHDISDGIEWAILCKALAECFVED